MSKKINLKGQVFHRWTVLEEDGRDPCGQVMWKCVCECGVIKTIVAGSLRRGLSKSCGCLNDEVRGKSSITHGLSKSVEYARFQSMKRRCYNEDEASFPRYGGKGVKVSDEWLGADGFEKFIAHIGMMPDYEQEWTLERIDHTGNYEPGNVKWMLGEFQPRNRGKMCTNTSGVTGVTFDENTDYPRYRVFWRNLDGTAGSKSFSTNRYGHEEAFRLACEHRKKMIEELNAQGAGYTDRHGT